MIETWTEGIASQCADIREWCEAREEGHLRLSSTSFNTAKRCPYLLMDQVVEGNKLPTSKAMAAGTVFHSIMEYVVAHGSMPIKADIERMPGNYEDPIEALKRYPSSWPIALRMARDFLANGKSTLMDGIEGRERAYELVRLEQSLDDFDLYILPGVKAGGYLDILSKHKQLGEAYMFIGDWKTRGESSWGFMPKTSAEITDTFQFAYYAAAWRQASLHGGRTPCKHVIVQHNNIYRPKNENKPSRHLFVEGAFTDSYLDHFWLDLQVNVVPALVRELMKGEEARRDMNGCFAYGPCHNLKRCYVATRPEEPKKKRGKGGILSRAKDMGGAS